VQRLRQRTVSHVTVATRKPENQKTQPGGPTTRTNDTNDQRLTSICDSLHLVHHAQQIAAPDFRNLRLGVTAAHQLPSDVLAGVIE